MVSDSDDQSQQTGSSAGSVLSIGEDLRDKTITHLRVGETACRAIYVVNEVPYVCPRPADTCNKHGHRARRADPSQRAHPGVYGIEKGPRGAIRGLPLGEYMNPDESAEYVARQRKANRQAATTQQGLAGQPPVPTVTVPPTVAGEEAILLQQMAALQSRLSVLQTASAPSPGSRAVPTPSPAQLPVPPMTPGPLAQSVAAPSTPATPMQTPQPAVTLLPQPTVQAPGPPGPTNPLTGGGTAAPPTTGTIPTPGGRGTSTVPTLTPGQGILAITGPGPKHPPPAGPATGPTLSLPIPPSTVPTSVLLLPAPPVGTPGGHSTGTSLAAPQGAKPASVQPPGTPGGGPPGVSGSTAGPTPGRMSVTTTIGKGSTTSNVTMGVPVGGGPSRNPVTRQHPTTGPAPVPPPQVHFGGSTVLGAASPAPLGAGNAPTAPAPTPPGKTTPTQVRRWYAVARGRTTHDIGIYTSYAEVLPRVHKVSGNLHQSFSSRAEAEAWLNASLQILAQQSVPATPSGGVPPQPSAPTHIGPSPGGSAGPSSTTPTATFPPMLPTATPTVASFSGMSAGHGPHGYQTAAIPPSVPAAQLTTAQAQGGAIPPYPLVPGGYPGAPWWVPPPTGPTPRVPQPGFGTTPAATVVGAPPAPGSAIPHGHPQTLGGAGTGYPTMTAAAGVQGPTTAGASPGVPWQGHGLPYGSHPPTNTSHPGLPSQGYYAGIPTPQVPLGPSPFPPGPPGGRPRKMHQPPEQPRALPQPSVRIPP